MAPIYKMNAFYEYAKNNSLIINRSLKDIFISIKSRSEGIDSSVNGMLDHIEEFSLRAGKKIRPLLVLMSYDIFGGKNQAEILKIASAYELLHNFLLIHDDLMDRSFMRRGKPTLHKIYEKRYKKIMGTKANADAKKSSESMAMLSGDTLLLLAQDVILDSGLPYRDRVEAMRIITKVLVNTCYGQAVDFEQNLSRATDEKKILKVYKCKTSHYSIGCPLALGAKIARARKKHLDILSGFSLPLGVAFQIQDDLLDVFSKTKNTGKDSYRDLKEGKMTLLVSKALEDAGPAQRKFLLDNLGDRKMTAPTANRIKKIIIDTGSYDYSAGMIKKLGKKAKDIITYSGLDKRQKSMLIDFYETIMTRKK